MVFSQIALLLVVAAIFAILAKFLRQPLLIGYLFAGLLLAFFGFIQDGEAISNLGKIGVTLLLFLVGLEMNLKELPTIGKTALITGVGQIIFTSVLGFLIASALGFGILPSVYISVALTFSSTIIIIKLLSEKGDLGTLYGKIAVGLLLVQDFVAVLILMFLAGIKGGEASFGTLVFVGIKALILFLLVWALSQKILPRFYEKFLSSSSELLFVVSLAWGLGVAAFVGGPLGFSFEIGGFLAGVALSNLPEHLGIASKTRPLRDFFLIIFFLALGTNLLVHNIGTIITPAIIFSLFVLIGNPLIVMIVMGIMRYKKRTSFLTSVTVAQISEFSFILMAMGQGMGHVTEAEVSLVILVGVITMTVSTYLILGSGKIYSKVKNLISIFERAKTREEILLPKDDFSEHIVLVGAGRTGRILLPYLRRKALPFVVIDYNPKIFAALSAEGTPIIFGDVEDTEIMETAKIEKARMVISTVSNFSDNLPILEYVRNLKSKPLVISRASTKEDAVKLYEAGATYVLVPEIMAGEYLRHIFLSHGLGEEMLKKMGKGHFSRLIAS